MANWAKAKYGPFAYLYYSYDKIPEMGIRADGRGIITYVQCRSPRKIERFLKTLYAMYYTAAQNKGGSRNELNKIV